MEGKRTARVEEAPAQQAEVLVMCQPHVGAEGILFLRLVTTAQTAAQV